MLGLYVWYYLFTCFKKWESVAEVKTCGKSIPDGQSCRGKKLDYTGVLQTRREEIKLSKLMINYEWSMCHEY